MTYEEIRRINKDALVANRQHPNKQIPVWHVDRIIMNIGGADTYMIICDDIFEVKEMALKTLLSEIENHRLCLSNMTKIAKSDIMQEYGEISATLELKEIS